MRSQIPLFAAYSLLAGVSVYGEQINGSAIAFTKFDYFKNTKLTFCKDNGTVGSNGSTQLLVPRAVAGGRSKGPSDGADKLISTINIRPNGEYCNRMDGVKIILPTIVNRYAYFPWWSQYLLRLISLGSSFGGLWYIWKAMARQQDRINAKIPILFWFLIPFDVARVIAWFGMSIWGLADPHEFNWATPIIWAISNCYIWLLKGMHHVLHSTPDSIALSDITQNTSYQSVSTEAGEFKSESKPYVDYSSSDYANPSTQPTIGDLDNPYSTATMNEIEATPEEPALRQHHPVAPHSLLFSSLLLALGILSFAIWVVNNATIGLGYPWPKNMNSYTLPVRLDPRVLQNPNVLSQNLPSSCAAYLKTANLPKMQLFTMPMETEVQMIINVALFVAPTIHALNTVFGALSDSNNTVPLGRRVNSALKGMFFWSVGALFVGLFATATYVGVASGKGKNVMVRYTNNASKTGGCSYAVVQMDRQFGYLDVPDGRVLRIVLAVLGL